ncbi:MAG: SGNH/GDSL hydrolase family protein [Planctomycetota bacterium]|nr:SGNH/GDSL hydrolase family protein [Planctomycetota bacterium]
MSRQRSPYSGSSARRRRLLTHQASKQAVEMDADFDETIDAEDFPVDESINAARSPEIVESDTTAASQTDAFHVAAEVLDELGAQCVPTTEESDEIELDNHNEMSRIEVSAVDEDREGILGVDPGLALVAECTDDLATIPIPRNDFRFRPDPTHEDTADSDPLLVDGLEELLASARPLTWLFAGDTITLGSRQSPGWRSYVELTTDHVRTDLHRLEDIVINVASEDETILKFHDRLHDRALRFRPDIVSFMLGLNDSAAGIDGRSRFRGRLERTLHTLKEHGIQVLLHTPPRTVTESGSRYRDLPAYVCILRELASHFGVPCIDHWQHWEETVDGTDGLQWLMDDGIRPGISGHQKLASLFNRHLSWGGRVFVDQRVVS